MLDKELASAADARLGQEDRAIVLPGLALGRSRDRVDDALLVNGLREPGFDLFRIEAVGFGGFGDEQGAAIGGEFAGRMGLPSISPMAERIMLERDVALLEATGGKLLVDQISSAQALETLARAKGKGLRINASVSINHLSFNELDIGDYRTFAKLNPPLRGEDDRQALIEALASGLIDIVVSSHSPAPAEDKRLPFDEAAPGAVGLETLLPALLSLYHEQRIALVDLIRAVTLAPAELLGLRGGRIAPGAPADLVLCDIDAPLIVDAARLLSKSKNSPFDGRRLQGQVLMTVVDGRVAHRAEG